jgi:hypothetical protein
MANTSGVSKAGPKTCFRGGEKSGVVGLLEINRAFRRSVGLGLGMRQRREGRFSRVLHADAEAQDAADGSA